MLCTWMSVVPRCELGVAVCVNNLSFHLWPAYSFVFLSLCLGNSQLDQDGSQV